MKVSIRDLFLVTAIVAACFAWWLDRSRLSARCRFSEEEIRQMVWARDHMEQVERELNKRCLEMVTVKGKIVIVPMPRPNQPKELSPVWAALPTSQVPTPNPKP
jgi:hypothetical protein